MEGIERLTVCVSWSELARAVVIESKVESKFDVNVSNAKMTEMTSCRVVSCARGLWFMPLRRHVKSYTVLVP